MCTAYSHTNTSMDAPSPLAGKRSIPSGPNGRVALDEGNLPLWFHGDLSFEVRPDALALLLQPAALLLSLPTDCVCFYACCGDPEERIECATATVCAAWRQGVHLCLSPWLPFRK